MMQSYMLYTMSVPPQYSWKKRDGGSLAAGGGSGEAEVGGEEQFQEVRVA